ncbi:MAG: hypothetical protein ABI776_16805, partial [Nocardioidaceae bacterium]
MHAATDCHPLGARQRAARATARWGVLLGAGALTLSGCGLFSSGEDTTGSSSAAPSSVTPSSV